MKNKKLALLALASILTASSYNVVNTNKIIHAEEDEAKQLNDAKIKYKEKTIFEDTLIGYVFGNYTTEEKLEEKLRDLSLGNEKIKQIHAELSNKYPNNYSSNLYGIDEVAQIAGAISLHAIPNSTYKEAPEVYFKYYLLTSIYSKMEFFHNYMNEKIEEIEKEKANLKYDASKKELENQITNMRKQSENLKNKFIETKEKATDKLKIFKIDQGNLRKEDAKTALALLNEYLSEFTPSESNGIIKAQDNVIEVNDKIIQGFLSKKKEIFDNDKNVPTILIEKINKLIEETESILNGDKKLENFKSNTDLEDLENLRNNWNDTKTKVTTSKEKLEADLSNENLKELEKACIDLYRTQLEAQVLNAKLEAVKKDEVIKQLSKESSKNKLNNINDKLKEDIEKISNQNNKNLTEEKFNELKKEITDLVATYKSEVKKIIDAEKNQNNPSLPNIPILPEEEKPNLPNVDNNITVPNVNENPKEATKGWVKVNDSWIYNDENGNSVVNYWIKHNNSWYYIKSDKKMATNEWLSYNGQWFWINASGRTSENEWVLVNNKWYYAKSGGYIAENEWVLINNTWYYAKSGGYIVQNQWHEVNGKWYYFDKSGALLVNTKTPDGYFVDENGAWIK